MRQSLNNMKATTSIVHFYCECTYEVICKQHGIEGAIGHYGVASFAYKGVIAIW